MSKRQTFRPALFRSPVYLGWPAIVGLGGVALSNVIVLVLTANGSIGMPVISGAAVSMAMEWALSSVLLPAIVFPLWLYIAYRNVETITGSRNQYSAGAPLWSWFAPYVAQVWPLLIVDEIWKRSSVGQVKIQIGRQGKKAQLNRVLLLWWVLFQVGFVATVVGKYCAREFYDTDALALGLHVGGRAMLIASAALGMIIVFKIQEVQVDAYKRRQTSEALAADAQDEPSIQRIVSHGSRDGALPRTPKTARASVPRRLDQK